jgi:hypothetical protein
MKNFFKDTNLVVLLGLIILLVTMAILCYGENIPSVQGVLIYKVTSRSAKVTVFIEHATPTDKVVFEYGKTSNYGKETVLNLVTTDIDDLSIFKEIKVTDLLPNTLYHYRVTVYRGHTAIHNADDVFNSEEDTGI